MPYMVSRRRSDLHDIGQHRRPVKRLLGRSLHSFFPGCSKFKLPAAAALPPPVLTCKHVLHCSPIIVKRSMATEAWLLVSSVSKAVMGSASHAVMWGTPFPAGYARQGEFKSGLTWPHSLAILPLVLASSVGYLICTYDYRELYCQAIFLKVIKYCSIFSLQGP